MRYAVAVIHFSEGEPPPVEHLEGSFESIEKAWDAGTAKVLEYKLLAIEAGFQIRDGDGRLVEVDRQSMP